MLAPSLSVRSTSAHRGDGVTGYAVRTGSVSVLR